mmetsp:Transcript_38423/g.63865  ORF Transcript_38423/g.63865 Transcript_38423/m.63865 type:complete len:759 (-) Transcript_38423:765-3041(-)
MNDVSSRSHAVFIVDLEQAERTNSEANPLLSAEVDANKAKDPKKVVRSSRLVLTDLAGSERVKRSGVEGKAMQEAQAINKSLSALGNVVNGLYMESKHIPYRDSKLTRLLRRSFVDPGSRILLITNLSPTGNSFGESLSSLRFADRVKGLKAAAISAGDVVAEQEFLERLRVSEQIAADVRIAQGATEYKIQRPRTRRKDVLTNKDYLKECISEYSAQVKREEQEKKERELRELQELVKKETDETIEAWRKKNEDMKSQCEEASQECERLQKEVETCKIDKEKEIEDRMTDAKKKKKDRRNAEERIEVIKKELIQATEDESRLTEEQKAAEGKYMDEEGADTKVWEQLEIKWNQEDERNKQAEQYVDKALVFLNAAHTYVAVCAKNQPQANELNLAKFEMAYEEVGDVVDEKIDWMIAVAVAGGNAKQIPKPVRKAAPARPAGDDDSDDGEDDDDDNLDYDPGMKPMGQHNTHVQSNRAQVAFGHDTVRTPYDEEEADRQYLMGIYDAENLIHDILKYLQSGTLLLKHGRNCKPHFRKFWISDDTKQLCWVDPDNPKSKRSEIDMKEVTSIVMGQYSKVFRRNQTDMTEPEFYLSFTLNCKNGKRTVDVVAETASEFEAWLMGLSHVLKMVPEWGKALDLRGEEGQNRLRKEELELCSKTHITPQLFLKLKEVVNNRREEVKNSIKLFNGDMDKVYQAVGGIHPPSIDKNGALLMTKGELRYLANIDIFRTCDIWTSFAEQKLIYDPAYRPPTPQVGF